jgi:hypothetical protein
MHATERQRRIRRCGIGVVERERHSEREAQGAVVARRNPPENHCVRAGGAVGAVPRAIFEVEQGHRSVLEGRVARQRHGHRCAGHVNQLDVVDVQTQVARLEARARIGSRTREGRVADAHDERNLDRHGCGSQASGNDRRADRQHPGSHRQQTGATACSLAQ